MRRAGAERPRPPAHVPVATYRLQLNHRFGFADAAAVVEYLSALGIGDCYLSPMLRALPGSEHGYDVIDHGALNPELGGDAAFARLVAGLRAAGIGMILDVVPNHMCIAGSHNRWWNDVLENGPSSLFAGHFDIDWRPPKPDLAAKVSLPILADQYGRVLENGEIAIRYERDTFVACYHDTRLPVAPRTWSHILEPALDRLRPSLGAQHDDVLELESILTALAHLPLRTETEVTKVQERQREKEIVRRRLAALIDNSRATRRAIDDSLAALNGVKGDPASFDRLESLIADQGYRPSYWRVAGDEINYRRFFDINELAAIRVEEPAVFEAVHEIALRLVARGYVTGLRIDHVDGLLLPQRYLDDLQRAWRDSSRADHPRRAFVVVEKILGPAESLPADWPVDGTTGYDFLNLVGGVLIDGRGMPELRRVYARFTGEGVRCADVVYESKKLVLRTAMSAELTVLARKLDRISEQHRASRDFTLNALTDALRELIACFPVYRTYIGLDDTHVRGADARHIEQAVREAKRRNPLTSASVFDFLGALLLLQDPSGLEVPARVARRDFVLRLQQLTGPVMAKGLEDTAFYRYFPLASLNEVGGRPDGDGVSVAEFHRANAERLRRAPHALSATATHDTKRSEDARARLAVLSEIPEEWDAAVTRWRALCRAHKEKVNGEETPDANEEYLLYQTLVAIWPHGGPDAHPSFAARMEQYAEKAFKEAKVRTSWINPNDAVDAAVRRFVRRVLDPEKSRPFLADIAALCARVEHAGYRNALAQVVLKIGSPGVPDFYQGAEMWDFSLVDPDNRRPVDFAAHRRSLHAIDQDGTDPAALAADAPDGRVKLFVTSRGLRFRRTHPDLFAYGSYVPVAVAGARADHIVSFARVWRDAAVLVATGRLFARAGTDANGAHAGSWRDTWLHIGALPFRCFRDTFTGCVIEATAGGDGYVLSAAEVFARLPVALLEGLHA